MVTRGANSRGQDNDRVGSTKGREFVEQLSDC
jgi:hypothetical protein